MGIMDFAPTAAEVNNSGNGNSNYRKPKAKLWANIGYDTKDGKTITTPVGVPVDTMDKVVIKGHGEEYIKRVGAQNKLLEMLQAIGDTMEPGESKKLTLSVYLTRTKEATQIPEEDNEYMVPEGFSLVAE